MKKLGRVRFLSIVLSMVMAFGLFTACGQTESKESEQTPETETGKATMVLRGGIIQTMDDNRSVVSAIAIENEKIVYVGNDSGVEEYIGENTEIVELNGKQVLPGFIDSHIHPASGWVTSMFECNLEAIEPSEEAYIKSVQEFADANPDLKAIIGKSFQLNAFDDLGPTKEALDAVVPDRPVVISDTSGHAYWVNSKAIELAGITDSTVAPEGGTIYRNEDGTVRGYFADVFLFNDILSMGKLTEEQFVEAWKNWQAEANSYGITSISGVDPYSPTEPGSEERWEIISDMAQEGQLTVRTNTSYAVPIYGEDRASDEKIEEIIDTLNNAQKYTSDYQVINSVKLYVDGVVEGRTAVLIEPYAPEANTEAGFKGVPIWSQDELNKITEAVDANGYAVHIHAIADGSTRMAIDAVENARNANGEKDSRHVLTHITIMDPSDMPRMADLGIIAAMQPIWFYRDPWFSQLEEQMLGTERFNRMYAIKDMVDAGIIMTGSADYSVLPDYRPLVGIETGATQCSPYEGEDSDPTYIRNADQAVSVMTMLEAYTRNGAYQMRMEDKIGSLEVGKLADMVILEDDILKMDLKSIAETKVIKTILGGKVVFEA